MVKSKFAEGSCDYELYAVIVIMASPILVIWKYSKNKLKVEWGKTYVHHPRCDATDPLFSSKWKIVGTKTM